MVVGVLRLTLYIHGASSLKDKRQVLRKVVDRLRSRFNVSVAEVGDNDVWQRAVVGICAVANERAFVNEVLDKCARDAGAIAEIINREMEIETYSEMYGEFAQKPELQELGPRASQASGLGPQASGKAEEEAEEPEAEPEAGAEAEADDESWLREEDLK
jgi:uncharacterized protein YlxP (DUF503 family)